MHSHCKGHWFKSSHAHYLKVKDKKDKINNMKGVFKGKIDKNISINELVLLGLFLLSKESKKADFEALLEKCFQLSPELIAFESHKWPDARKIDRPLRNLRNKGLVSGSPDSYFSLTVKGKEEALKINKELYQGKLL